MPQVETKPREAELPDEIARTYGLRVHDVRQIARATLARKAGARLYVDDVLAALSSRRDIDNLDTLIAKICALEVTTGRLENLWKFLAETLGIQPYVMDFSDEDLFDIAELARQEIRSLTVDQVADWTNLLTSLTDRDLRRMDRVTGEARSWRHIIFRAEDMADRLARRTDRRDDLFFQNLRADLNMALSQFVNQAKFSLALTNPQSDPHELMGVLRERASKVNLKFGRTPTDVHRSLIRLIQTSEASRTKTQET